MQPSDSSLFDFGFLSVLRDGTPLTLVYLSSVMNASSDLLSGSTMDAFIVASCDTVVRSETDLTWDIAGKCVPEEALTSGWTGLVLSGLGGAALGLSFSFDLGSLRVSDILGAIPGSVIRIQAICLVVAGQRIIENLHHQANLSIQSNFQVSHHLRITSIDHARSVFARFPASFFVLFLWIH